MNNQTTNNYTPSPVDTANIQLPEELMALAEAISKNVYEVWAQNRMNEGWTYGEDLVTAAETLVNAENRLKHLFSKGKDAVRSTKEIAVITQTVVN